jgi:hypothetical protein
LYAIVWLFGLSCCFLSPSFADDAVLTASQSRHETQSKTQIDTDIPAADRLDANQRRLVGEMAATSSGPVLAGLLEVLAWDAPRRALADAPAPRADALDDYFRTAFPGANDSNVFWATYPADWTAGLRQVLTQNLRRPLDARTLRHAVSLLPLFFGEEQAAAIDAPEALYRALLADRHGAPGQTDADRADADRLFHRGLVFWVRSCWRQGSAGRRDELASLLLDASRQPTSAGARTFLERWDRDVPLSFWLARHADRFDRCLRDPDRRFRQQVLTLVLRSRASSAVSLTSPALQAALIEALANDDLPGNATLAERRLAQAGDRVRPILNRAYVRSLDRQQKSALTELVDPRDDLVADDVAGADPLTSPPCSAEDSITAGRNQLADVNGNLPQP